MNDLEMEIGRTLGASAFFIYQAVKNNPRLSTRDIEVETGLSYNQIQVHLKNLRECNILKRDKVFLTNTNGYLYTPNEKELWKFH